MNEPFPSEPDPEAVATAAQTQRETNRYWQHHLGDPGPLGGFQVNALRSKRDGAFLFVSTLYGGRRVVGTGHEIRECSTAYVDSRRRNKTQPRRAGLGEGDQDPMTAAENLTTTEQVYDFPLADIKDPSIPNYRTTFEGMDELTASVKESGIQVPLVLRPVGGDASNGHELAIGARRLEAARRAGLESVPVFIRQYTDDELLVARAIENLQRVNPDPLDEAAGFQVLVKAGYSVAALAEKLGQSVAYVGQRLKLTGLCQPVREALTKGEISIGVAVLIARLPDTKTQQKALKECEDWSGNLMSVQQARENIESRVLLDLESAPFKLDDATLVPSAGACSTCDKRTGNQAQLFPNDSSPDQCTDPPCHKSKLDALWQLRTKTAKADGITILPKKDTEEVLRHASEHGGGPLVRLDETIYSGGKSKKLRQLFGKELPPVTLARDIWNHTPVELVPRKEAEKAIKAFKPSSGPTAAERDDKADAKAAKEREAEKLQAEVRRRTVVALVAAMEKASPDSVFDKQVLQVLTLAAVHSMPPDVAKVVANRRGCPLGVEEGGATDKKGKGKRQQQLTPEQRLRLLVDTLEGPQLGGLLLELLIHRAAPGKWSEAHESYDAATMLLGVDVAAIESAVKAERKEKAGAKAAKPRAPKAKAGPLIGEDSRGVMHFMGKGGHNACGTESIVRVGEGQTNSPSGVTCGGCLPFAKAAAAKAEAKTSKKKAAKTAPRPEHPATGQTVHYLDPDGLSATGAKCGGKVGGGKGILTEEPKKVTRKSCRRVANLDNIDETAGAEDTDDDGDDA